MKTKFKILLIISGGISAYKSLDLVRLLKKNNYELKTVLTKNSDYFQGHNAKAPDEVIIKYSVEAATIKTLLMRGEHEISSMWLPNEVLAALEKEDPIFELQFPRFAYRWKYSDGEYSAFSPFLRNRFL